MQKILVTDTLFIFPEHEARLCEAGYEVERLEKSNASEDELIAALSDKVGYVLGGIEQVTDKVLESTNTLKSIVFTGADWRGYIPGYKTAADKGIVIANTPGANSFAVAEYTVTLLMMMLRRALELGRTGNATFMTVDSLKDVHIGILGTGRIGERVARMLKGLGANNISYYNRTRKPDLETELGITYLSPDELLAKCDVITNHLSSEAGEFVSQSLLEKAKEGALIINTGFEHSFDMDVLFELIAQRGVRAAFDNSPVKDDERYAQLPVWQWFSSNEGTAYNTVAACKQASDMAVDSLINILTTGDDPYVVNKG